MVSTILFLKLEWKYRDGNFFFWGWVGSTLCIWPKFILFVQIRKDSLCPSRAYSNVNTIAGSLWLQLDDFFSILNTCLWNMECRRTSSFWSKNVISRESTSGSLEAGRGEGRIYRVLIQHLVFYTGNLISANTFQSPLSMTVCLYKYPPGQQDWMSGSPRWRGCGGPASGKLPASCPDLELMSTDQGRAPGARAVTQHFYLGNLGKLWQNCKGSPRFSLHSLIYPTDIHD